MSRPSSLLLSRGTRLSTVVVPLLLGALAGPAWTDEARKPTVIVTVSVDWEGRDLAERNLTAFEAFREALPKVPITHFLNAAYYTKDKADRESVTKQIRRTIRPGDETGLHVHAWRSLVRAAGVEFKAGPTFWGPDAHAPKDGGDWGHEVELPAYSKDELVKVVHESAQRLREAGFELTTSFRAGGWIATTPVLAAVRREGFLIDSSAVDSVWHERLRGTRLPGRIREVWPDVHPTTQPFVVVTGEGPVLEMPDTGALADYVTSEQLAEHIRSAVGRAVADSGTVFVHVGFHQETAAQYASRVRDAIAAVATETAIEFLTLRDAAARARAALTLDAKNEVVPR
jgi:hypothetical protein